MSEPLTPEPSRSVDAASPPVRTGSIPMADQLLSEQSRAWVEKHPIPTSDTTAPPRASSLPTADQLLSEQSRAWVQKHPIPTGDTEGPIRASSLPLAEQLLSEQSRAWVREHSPSANAVPAIPPLTTESLPAIAGYHIGRRIGRGGMGTVYECRREGLADHLAIKIITSGRYAAEEERRRFMSEIGMLLRLHHPNLSRLRDFGQDGAIAWFVMDFIEGKPFTTWLDEEKPSWEVLAAMLGHAARAIAHAHRQGIVHRDLNPSNVMVLADHHPVVMDFGLARDLASDEVLTMSGMTVGTPPYMSPEQTLGTKGVLSPRTDIWGIGGILYHGITGRPPFDGGSNHEIFTAINEVDPVRPRAYAPSVPSDLERICLRCLQRDPADRYSDMDALASDLERFAAGDRVGVRLPGFFTRMWRRARHRPLPWVLGSALVVLASGFLGYAGFDQVRRWAAWSAVLNSELANARDLPPGLMARDSFYQPWAQPPLPDATGLGPVREPGSTDGLAGWWWLEGTGLLGGVRVSAEFETPINDAIEIAVNAAASRPREGWHHPAGWGVKIQSADVLSLAVAYQEQPAPLQTDNGFLLERPPGSNGHLNCTVEIRGTTCTVHVAGSTPVVINEPLALGGNDRQCIGLRFYSSKTRLRHLRIERLATPELVSPLAGPDALLRHGRSTEAVAEYRLLAADHPNSDIADQALLRAFAERCRVPALEDQQRTDLYEALRQRGPGPLLDTADRIRAVALWGSGQSELALGVARDLTARRPDLNPVQAFLGDRTWRVPATTGSQLVDLLARTPNSVGVSLAELGLVDLSPLAGRKAWSIVVPDNQLTDLSPIADSGCTYLNAARNRISDVRPLFGLRELIRLNLLGNQITDPTPLNVLPALRSLDLTDNRITSLAGLPTSLSELSASRNPLASLSGLPVATLQRLSLAQTPITDLAPLQAATLLNTLDISDTQVRDPSPLAKLPITWLKANHAQQLDISRLVLPQVRKLTLSGNERTQAHLIPQPILAGLYSLDLSDTATAYWPAIASPDLRELSLTRCRLIEATSLTGLTSLRKLDLRGNQLTDATPLTVLTNLNTLDLRDNQLRDLTPLLLAPPTILLVSGNPLTRASCQALIDCGRQLQRPDLVWQGASLLYELHGDLQALRAAAIPHGGQRFAIFIPSQRLTAAAAAAHAVRNGAHLAILPDAQINQRLTAGLPTDADPWMGLSLTGNQLVQPDGTPATYRAALPPVHYRGYTAVPADGGSVTLLTNGTWGIAPSGLAWGAVFAWDGDW